MNASIPVIDDHENALLGFVLEKAGENLRTIVYCSETTYDVMCLRDELSFPDVLIASKRY